MRLFVPICLSILVSFSTISQGMAECGKLDSSENWDEIIIGVWRSNWGLVFIPESKVNANSIQFSGYWFQDTGRLGVIKEGTLNLQSGKVLFKTLEPFLKDYGEAQLDFCYSRVSGISKSGSRVSGFSMSGNGQNLVSGEKFTWEMEKTDGVITNDDVDEVNGERKDITFTRDNLDLKSAQSLMYKKTCPANISGCSFNNRLYSCHPSCGHYCQDLRESKTDKDDCMSCPDGSFLNIIYRDGTGVCTSLN